MAGRPPKEIDWKMVDMLLEAGCTGTEIASKFDMHHDTFYDKVKETHNISFTAYAQGKSESGKANLRASMYSRALKGNDKLTLHLAKHMLGQWDKLDHTLVNSETSQQILALMSQLQGLQQKTETNQLSDQSDLNICENNINPAT